MRRKAPSDLPLELPKGTRKVELEGAGCLVVLGLFGLPLVFLFFGVLAFAALSSLRKALDLTSLSTFLPSFSAWMHEDVAGTGTISLCWLFAVGYCALLWQWIAFVKRWQKGLLRPTLLWGMSSAYFVAAMIAIGVLTAHFTESHGEWTKATLLAWLIPGSFLFSSLPLWWASWKSPDNSARVDF